MWSLQSASRAAIYVELCWACRALTLAVIPFGQSCQALRGLLWACRARVLGVPRSLGGHRPASRAALCVSCSGPARPGPWRALQSGRLCHTPQVGYFGPVRAQVLGGPSFGSQALCSPCGVFARPVRDPKSSLARKGLFRARGSRAQFAKATCERRRQRLVSGRRGPWRAVSSLPRPWAGWGWACWADGTREGGTARHRSPLKQGRAKRARGGTGAARAGEVRERGSARAWPRCDGLCFISFPARPHHRRQSQTNAGACERPTGPQVKKKTAPATGSCKLAPARSRNGPGLNQPPSRLYTDRACALEKP